MASHRNMRIEIFSVSTPSNGVKPVEWTVPAAELFMTASAVFAELFMTVAAVVADLLLPLIRKS